MPDFDLDYLEMERVTLLYVNAVMLLPNDARERGALLHASLAATLPASPVRDDERMDLALVKYLLAAPKPEQVLSLRRLKTILYKTEFSGLVLQTVLRAAAHDYRDIASVSAVLRGFATQTARKLETMEEDWHAYSRVSHLWLALDLYLGGDLNRCAADRRLLLRLLAYAEELRKRGEAWVPKRGSTPILDAAHTWKVPAAFELPPVQLSFEPPTPHELKLFGNKRG